MKAITAKYLGPTDRRGAKISVTDFDGHRRLYSYDYAARDPWDKAVLEFCKHMSWGGMLVVGCQKPGVNVYVFDPDVAHDAPLTIKG